MVVCNFPKTSSKIGQTSTSCLRKFTIHFRRPDKLKQKKDAPYKGEFGFDWLRDEYIYPIEKVELDRDKDENAEDIEKWRIDKIISLCLNPTDLRKEYLKITDGLTSDFKPYKQDYYPAWLSIFACDVKDSNAYAGSDMHKDGVYLDLQLDEIDEIIDDGTEIFFKPSDPCLKITPEKISISEFLNTSKKTRELDKNTGEPKINYYLLTNAVKIICQGGTLKQHEKIRVFAKLGATEIEVGQLMVYQNNNIGKINIFVINLITEYDNNNKVIPQSHPSLEYLLNYQSFNQAMIKAEIKAIENFDLVALIKNSKKMNDDDNVLHNVNLLLKKIKEEPQFLKDDNSADIIVEVISKAYSKYGKYVPKNIKNINEEGHYNTYLFFSTIHHKTEEGNSQVIMNKDETLVFGNMSLIFRDYLKKDFNIVHELGHSFSLPHTFQRDEKKYKPQHSFYRGYTENYMDYEKKYIKPPVNSNFKNKNTVFRAFNNYKDNMYSFYKWQWDTMRKDKSIENNEKK
ncbi:hypothetical protein ACFX2U_01535 [Gilliamella apicola]|uniref:hypothetical protein n=1 Tax=Gilliamella apicola TaxID=1196095 RepID=UPI003987E5B2